MSSCVRTKYGVSGQGWGWGNSNRHLIRIGTSVGIGTCYGVGRSGVWNKGHAVAHTVIPTVRTPACSAKRYVCSLTYRLVLSGIDGWKRVDVYGELCRCGTLSRSWSKRVGGGLGVVYRRRPSSLNVIGGTCR